MTSSSSSGKLEFNNIVEALAWLKTIKDEILKSCITLLSLIRGDMSGSV